MAGASCACPPNELDDKLLLLTRLGVDRLQVLAVPPSVLPSIAVLFLISCSSSEELPLHLLLLQSHHFPDASDNLHHISSITSQSSR
eukprot:13052355-Heterocapsa_arctica.AAC.1